MIRKECSRAQTSENNGEQCHLFWKYWTEFLAIIQRFWQLNNTLVKLKLDLCVYEESFIFTELKYIQFWAIFFSLFNLRYLQRIEKQIVFLTPIIPKLCAAVPEGATVNSEMWQDVPVDGLFPSLPGAAILDHARSHVIQGGSALESLEEEAAWKDMWP